MTLTSVRVPRGQLVEPCPVVIGGSLLRVPAVQTVPVAKAVCHLAGRFFRIRMLLSVLFLVLGERVLAVILKRKVLPD